MSNLILGTIAVVSAIVSALAFTGLRKLHDLTEERGEWRHTFEMAAAHGLVLGVSLVVCLVAAIAMKEPRA